MNIAYLPIDSVVPYPKNNRKHPESQIGRIADAIKQFGFNQPIVIDDNNVCLVGHGRLLAAKKLGLDKIPTHKISGLSESQKRAYRILDNKLQNDSAWEFENLEQELLALEAEGFELEPWGLEELKDLFPEPEHEVYEDEGTGELPTETYIKRGDVIELGAHRVLCGDCTEDFDFPVCNMCITDPPYGVAYIGKTKDALIIESDDFDEEQLTTMWRQVINHVLTHLNDGGTIYATVPPGPLRQVFSQELKDREVLRQELVWYKDSMVLGRSDYHYQHEPILYGWKPGAAHYFTDDRTRTSVLVHPRPKASREHPTMKPITLWAELIANSSCKQDKVLDPFLGSGTTLIACDQLDRICYGIEIDPKYCQVIIERYKKHCEKVGKPFECKINGEVFNG